MQKIDVVISYVDMDDREWLNSYLCLNAGWPFNIRFRSYKALDLQIKLVRKNMPFVRDIFVVVSSYSQVEGIDLSNAKVVLHEEFIPKDFLPTFNSYTIEMFMPFINGIADRFIYFNDDMFMTSYATSNMFFNNGKEVMDYAKIALNEDSEYSCNCCNACNLVAKNICKDKNICYLTPSHFGKPFFTSFCKKVFNDNEHELTVSLTQVRSSCNISTYFYSLMQHFMIGSCPMKLDEFQCIGLSELNIRTKFKTQVCINDDMYNQQTIDNVQLVREMLMRALNSEQDIEIKLSNDNSIDALLMSMI